MCDGRRLQFVQFEFAIAGVGGEKAFCREVGVEYRNELVADMVAKATGEDSAKRIWKPSALNLEKSPTNALDFGLMLAWGTLQ